MDVDYPALLAMFQEEAGENLASMEEALVGLEHAPDDDERLNTLFRAAHTIKGNSDSLGLRPLAELAHALEDLLELFRGRRLPVTRERIDVLLESVDALRGLLAQAEGPTEDAAPAALVARLEAAAAGGERRASRKKAKVLPSDARASAAATPERDGASAQLRTQRVAVAKLDRLLDLATEIAIDRGRLRQGLSGTANVLLDDSEHLYAELHDLVMRSRLVPLRPVLAHFARVARDLARATGKDAELVIEERGVEVDIRMAEGLRDPLTHMLRNAFDHGVEDAKLRRARGKDPRARLGLRARHDAGGVRIELEDDGGGLDRARILARAVERGLVKGGETLDDAAVYELVFAPGLSTAAAVTELSGRGVGLDVVKKQVEALRGTVEIASEPGRGTTLTLHLPLTLAIVDALAVGVAGQTYLIPMEWVEECVELEGGASDASAGLVERKGRSLPLLPLARLFGRPSAAARPRVVVARHDGGELGIVVDALLGARQAVIKPLSSQARGLPVFSGSSILGDGQVALMLDVAALVAQASARPRTSEKDSSHQRKEK
jgi:two-component system chemotaxis sensor kinase CheA